MNSPSGQNLDVILSPRELTALDAVELKSTVCVVFDILRATTSMITALAQGAEAILPVAEIAEAVAIYRERPDVLLAGERHGLPPGPELTGGVAFHFGNSPRSFTQDRVRGRTLAWTTTNGTRALRACVGARAVLVSSFLNLEATARWLEASAPRRLWLVCSGTENETAAEDVLAAGALVERLAGMFPSDCRSDAAVLALDAYTNGGTMTLAERLGGTRNGRRLMSLPALCDDVPLCAARDTVGFAAELVDGVVRRIG